MLRRKVWAPLIFCAGVCAAAGAAGQSAVQPGQTPAGSPPRSASAPGRASSNDATETARKPPAHPEVARALQSLADWVKGRGGRVTAGVVDLESGAWWASASPETALNPASNMKIVTAAVALDRLGAEFRFATGLYGKRTASHIETLVLRGHGDPSLATTHLRQLVAALVELGVESVGAILVDQSRFDAEFVPPAFEQQPHEWARFRAPISAVALDRNSVTLSVLPGAAGQPARAWFEPPGVVRIEGAVETRAPGAGERIQLALRSEGTALVATLGGYVAAGLPRLRFDRRLDDPRRAPGLALRELLSRAGVRVPADVGLGGEDVKERLVFHQSEPLGVLLSELGKNSDNFYAEMIFKVLGAESEPGPASSAAGARAVNAWLAARGLLTPETRIENGSGLFDANRLSAKTLLGVLGDVQRSPRLFPELAAQLAIGGVDGTLRSRFAGLKDTRRVRAKTGTLAAVASLSGYVLDPAGKAPVAFAMFVSDIEGHVGDARRHMDRVVEAIARARPRAAAR